MRRKVTVLALLLALALPAVGAGAGPDRPRRYVSLAPSTTEILFALGLDAEIVGVSSYCNYPAAAGTKEKVGDFSRPNIERIVALKPDYIFCTGLEQDPAVDRLRRLRIPLYIADPADLEGLLATIIDIGDRTGRKEQARRLVDDMRARMRVVADAVRGVPAAERPRVFIEIWDAPLMTAGRGSFIDELISAAGGVNIAYDTIRPYTIFSSEAVLRRDPDCIVMAYMDGAAPEERLKRRAGWDNVRAVRQNRVYGAIAADILLRPGPRVVDAIEALQRVLYDKRDN